MDVERLAFIYVHILEPALKVLAFLVLVVTVLYIFNAIGDSKKKTDFVNSMFNLLMKSVVVLFTGLGRLGLILGRLLLRVFTLLVATVRDFFTSKI
jgi:hypothetical protein